MPAPVTTQCDPAAQERLEDTRLAYARLAHRYAALLDAAQTAVVEEDMFWLREELSNALGADLFDDVAPPLVASK